MLVIHTELRPSPIHGLGVFSLEDVASGQLVLRSDQRIDLEYHVDLVVDQELPACMKQWLKRYGTRWGDTLFISLDDSRFMNHSSDPNVRISWDEDGWWYVAVRPIAVGDEVTCDYAEIDEPFASGDRGEEWGELDG